MRRPVPILFVMPVGQWGGAESLFFELMRRLDRERFAPRAVFLRDGPFVREVERAEIPMQLISITRLRDPVNFVWTVRRICATVEREGVRLVASSHGYGHLYGGMAAWWTRRPAIWWQHGMASAGNLVDRVAARLPARVVIASSQGAAQAHRRILKTCALCVIYPGVDIGRFQEPDPQRLREVRAQFRLERFRHIVSTIGHLERGKGQDDFVRAAACVRAHRSDVGFLIVGEERQGARSAYAAELRRLVEALHLRDHVIFTGFRREIPELLAVSDVVVHAATAPESFGLALCEAMAAGRAVIATDLGGAREIIVPGETGLLVPPRRPAAVADAVLSLLRDPERRHALGRAAQERVRAHFSIHRTVTRFETLLDECL